MAHRSPDTLLELFATHTVVEFEQMQTALDNASRATTFRYLQQVAYHRSYNYNGRYYTRKDPSRYDRFGLFSYNDIYFSCDPTLGETIRRLVWESEAGWTQRELQDLLKVRVQVVLLGLYRQHKVTREKIGGFYVYLHSDADVCRAQRMRRQEKIDLAERIQNSPHPLVSDDEIIQVLLTLLHHPGAQAAEVARYLRGHSPPITLPVVRLVFDRYGLDSIG